jgi:ketosteroid isomerase-like protein
MPTPQRVQALVAQVEQGRVLDAFEAFYADDVVMQENVHPPTAGKAGNRDREHAFLATVARVDGYRAAAVLVDGDRAVINWVADFLGTDGVQYHMDQVALQTWRGAGDDARIVHERFVYDPTTLAAGPAAEAGV